MRKLSILELALFGGTAALGWLALAIALAVAIDAPVSSVASVAQNLIQYFSYFTILINASTAQRAGAKLGRRNLLGRRVRCPSTYPP
jgi:hypothetical protein